MDLILPKRTHNFGIQGPKKLGPFFLALYDLGVLIAFCMNQPPPKIEDVNKRKVGELQALRAAGHFVLGLGAFAAVLCVWFLILFLKSPQEEKNSDLHKNDPRNLGIVFVVAVAVAGAGWKLRSYVKAREKRTGQSAKPFGWMP